MLERWRIRRGDRVEVICGDDKGKRGDITKVFRKKGRVIVSGVNMLTKHIKPSQKTPGGVIKTEGSIHVSNVMLIDPETDKVTRISMKITENEKVRYSKRSGKAIVN